MNDIVTKDSKSGFVKYLPFLVILGGLTLALSQGWHKFLTPQALGEHAVYLNMLVENNLFLMFIGFIALYAVCTAFMIPGSILTVSAGFLFGLVIGAPAVIVGATIGACVLFLAAKSSIGETLKKVAGPFMAKMEAGFNENPLSYMFTSRLIPIFPFAVVNIAPALLGAKFRDYFISTALGIIPGTVAYTWIGAGLQGTLLDAAKKGETADVGALIASAASNLLPAFIALGCVAMMPIIYNKFIKKTEKTPA